MPPLEVTLTTVATFYPTEKFHSYCFLFTVLNSSLIFYSICFQLLLRHSRPSEQLLSSCFLLWPWPMT